jgi:DinB superfamily
VFLSERKQRAVDKVTFISTLQQARVQWEALLGQMDEQRMLQPGIVGIWSVKDLIAHVSWYEREMIPVIRQRVFSGSEWWALPTDERNEMIYQEHRQRPMREILQEGQCSYTELLEAVQSLSDEDLNDARHFRDMPEDWIP